ncbi:MAG TPA: short-chain dehydrogenase [Acidimicrobiaceae bacterium]|nr:short-chain dehydrogenase [Acidimicrobiaceae bacterium]
MRSLKGMSLLITGGGSGIGLGAAQRFGSRGALVTISGRREEPLRDAAEQIGVRCNAVVGDVTVAADRQRMVDAAVEHGGGLDALLSLAGNMHAGALGSLEEDRLLDLFHSNVVAGVMLAQCAEEHLAASKGSIVFAASVHTRRAFPGASGYAATKGAIEALTGVLAAELGRKGIRVNSVRPGGVHTEILVRGGMAKYDEESRARVEGLAAAHVLGRIGTTEEIAEALEYLVRAEWTTGEVLTVDGGLSLGATKG